MSDVMLFGMPFVYDNKIVNKFRLRCKPLKIANQKKLALNDYISRLPKELLYQIIAPLEAVDKNTLHQTSYLFKNVCSKKIRNVYGFIFSKQLNVTPKDLYFIEYLVEYDQNKFYCSPSYHSPDAESISKKYDAIFYKLENMKWDNKITWPTWDNISKNKTNKLVSPVSSLLGKACFYSDIHRLKKLFKGNCLTPAVFCLTSKVKELTEAFEIAVKKNDQECLNVLASALAKNLNNWDCSHLEGEPLPSYIKEFEYFKLLVQNFTEDMLKAYFNLMAIALKQAQNEPTKQKSFEFLACHFPMPHTLRYFVQPFEYHSEQRNTALYSKPDYKNKIKYCSPPISYFPICELYYSTLSWVVNRLNNERKRIKLSTKAAVFANQDKDLDVVVEQPLIDALNSNKLDTLASLLSQLEEQQFLFDLKQRSEITNCLFSIHIKLLEKARNLNDREAFFLLVGLRLVADSMPDPMIYPHDKMDKLCGQYRNNIAYQIDLMERQQSSSIMERQQSSSIIDKYIVRFLGLLY